MAITDTSRSGHRVLPAPGIWTLDPTHTEVTFTARHLMVTKVRGRFPIVSGALTVAENPLESSVEAVIDVAGVHSGESGRDDHLRSEDFFHAEAHPTITFRSTSLEGEPDGELRLTGDLTIKGVTRPVTLDVEYLGTIESPWGDERAGFSASTTVNRKDWGLSWNVALEAGGVVVGDNVKLEIEAEAIRQK
jgi:polyisoprenoid-binding protein YceI